MMQARRLGRSGIEVSPIGFGCWAIGGPFLMDGLPDGWGDVDDRESIKAIHAAFDAGINFFDTADVYGTGHSEQILGKALQGRRHNAVIATKFGYTYHPGKREIFSKYDVSKEYIRKACELSLKRLATDYIDLYQIHVGDLAIEKLDDVIELLEELKKEGKIRAYGWSTWDKMRAELFSQKSSNAGATIQHPYNVLIGEAEMVELCERNRLASVNNSPLAMGLLSGKFTVDSHLPADDVRGSKHEWVVYFKDGKPKLEYLKALESIREILTSGGRTLVQGALAWNLGKSAITIPIPGFKTERQVKEAAGVISKGPLTTEQIEEIEVILLASSLVS